MQLEETAKTPDERAMLACLTKNLQVTLMQLQEEAGVSAYARSNYVAKLRNNGLLLPCGKRSNKVLFTIHDQQSRTELSTKLRKQLDGVMWETMRIMKSFTAQDIVVAIADARDDITLARVQEYCRLLLKSNYLKVQGKGPKKSKNPTRFMLVNNTGPLPPLKKTVPVIIDGNTGRVAYVSGDLL